MSLPRSAPGRARPFPARWAAPLLAAGLATAVAGPAQAADTLPAGFTNLVEFGGWTAADGFTPMFTPTLASDGNLYGVTQYGGNSYYYGGIVYRIDRKGRRTTLHNFAGGYEGANPEGGLAEGPGGLLYGSTYSDGAGCGLLYRLAKDGSGFEILHTMMRSEGCNLTGRVLPAPDGSVYATAMNGGADGGGAVLRWRADSGVTVLHSFASPPTVVAAPDGRNPFGGVRFDGANTLVGTTVNGGQDNVGTVFRYSLATGAYRILAHASASGPNHPYSAVVRHPQTGDLWGTFVAGGAAGGGAVWRIPVRGPQQGQLIIAHEFAGPTSFDGFQPTAEVTMGPNGLVLGTTQLGGLDVGTIFSLQADGSGYTQLLKFDGVDGTGQFPFSGLVWRPRTGSVIGTTTAGGAHGAGTVFEFVLPR